VDSQAEAQASQAQAQAQQVEQVLQAMTMPASRARVDRVVLREPPQVRAARPPVQAVRVDLPAVAQVREEARVVRAELAAAARLEPALDAAASLRRAVVAAYRWVAAASPEPGEKTITRLHAPPC
jgi:hypothetical protein